MGKHFVFEHHEGGFFSNFNKVITHLTFNKPGQITWNLQGQPYGAFAYNCGEVFSKLFKNVIVTSGNHEVENVKEFQYLNFTGKNTHDLYINEDKSWRKSFNKTYKSYIHFTKSLQAEIDKVDEMFSKIPNTKIGILKRNQLLKCEQLNNKMPEFEQYASRIEAIDQDATCVLSVDNYDDLNRFDEIYNCVYSKKIRRTNKDTDREPHFTPCSADDAISFFIDVYMLSKCHYLIHPISNMATAALYMNPNLNSIYIKS